MSEQFEEIIEIKEIGEVETYDLEIDSEYHNYYANGVCVSNSHSLSYSYLAMQTLYLKRYYPVQFYTALLNHPKTSGDKEKIQAWIGAAIASAISKGIEIKPPSRKSGWKWTMTGENEISMGLSGINGMGEIAFEELQTVLKSHDKTLDKIDPRDFFGYSFSKFNKASFENCVKSGLFDDWSDSREYLLTLKEKGRKKKKIATNQLGFSFEDDIQEDYVFVPPNQDVEKYRPTSKYEKEKQFKEVCNFDLTRIERITKLKDKLNKQAMKKSGKFIESIINFEEDEYYFFVLESMRVQMTKTEKPMLVLTVGDGINSKVIRIFEPLLSKMKDELENEAMYVAKFSKNKKGFINIDSNRKFKRFK